MAPIRQRLAEVARRFTSDTFYVRLIYYYSFLRRRRIPELLNLRRPKTWNEKIIWIKLNIDRLIPNAHLYADKLMVREYVAGVVGEDHLVPLLGSWERAEEISWPDLPESFVLKANHGSGFNIVVRDRSEFDIDQVTNQLNTWLERDYSHAGGETQYHRIPRRLLAEELLGHDTSDLIECHFYCFDGKPEFMRVAVDKTDDFRRLYLDMDWNQTPFRLAIQPLVKKIERPAGFDQMVSLAERLAAPFHFVRVDLYELEGSVFFGELTFTPGAGRSIVLPRAWNRKLGDLIHLPM